MLKNILMTEMLTQSLAKIVTGNRQAAAVFEKYHFDFCCKGKRTLRDACKESQVNPLDVLADMEKALAVPDAAGAKAETMALSELSEYIVSTHHTYVRNEMPLIFGYLQKVAAKHGSRHPELLKIFELFAAVKEEMDLHMMKEEKILFPRISDIEKLFASQPELPVSNSYISGPVSVMEQEHDHAGWMLNEIRMLTTDYTPPADACTTYRLAFTALRAFEEDLHRHVHLENNVLFPKAMKLFSNSMQQN